MQCMHPFIVMITEVKTSVWQTYNNKIFIFTFLVSKAAEKIKTEC